MRGTAAVLNGIETFFVILKQARSAPLKNLGRGLLTNVASAFECIDADGWHAHAEVTCGMQASETQSSPRCACLGMMKEESAMAQ